MHNKPAEFQALQPIIPVLLKLYKADLGKVHPERKTEEETVTETDRTIERLITKTIITHFPNDSILGEELSPDVSLDSKRVWAVDPICGTFNFSGGVPLSATNISLFEEEQPVFALVIDHAQQTYYWTSAENQRVFQEEKLAKPERLAETHRFINADFGNLIYKKIPYSTQSIEAFANIIHELINKRYVILNFLSSLSATYAALGKRAAFLIPATNPWDLAPACYFTEKNGGVSSDFSGKPFGLNSTSAVGSLDKELHQKLLSIIQRHWIL